MNSNLVSDFLNKHFEQNQFLEIGPSIKNNSTLESFDLENKRKILRYYKNIYKLEM